jgi:hypothetical protein
MARKALKKNDLLKINLQLFAGKVRNKAEGLSKEDLESLKDELKKNDDEDPDDDPDEDPEEDPEDDDPEDENREDVEEDPENDPGDDPEEDPEEEPDEDPEEEKPEESDPTDKKPPVKDKKENAIIALKAENKELKKRLDEIERRQQEREYDNELDRLTSKYTQELIDDGMDEEKAKVKARKQAETEIENKKVADRLFDIELERLEEKGYIDIRSKSTVLKPLVKAGLTLEEAYRAKFGAIKEKELKTRAELLALKKKQENNTKKVATATGSTKTEEKVKMSKTDERIFKEISKSHKGMFKNKKEFADIMKDFTD